MTIQALAGLAVLNFLYLVTGAALLWLVRGLDTWTTLLRLAGLAYLIGLAFVGGVWTLLLVVGVPFGLGAVIAVPLVASAAAAALARWRSRVVPEWRVPRVERRHLVAAVGIAAVGVFIEALFRTARLSGLYWWDAWAFWVPKGKAIYMFGELDVHFFTTLPGASYPPLLPVLDAAAFHAMGSADVVTLHVQFWLFGVGFLWALAGLLSERVPPWILWPFMLLVAVAPRIGRRFFIAEADLLLDAFFTVAAVLVVIWLADRQRWRLACAVVLMCGMVLTKREGMLLAAVLLAAAALAGIREWRFVLPRLGVAALCVVLVAAPWRIWYLVRGVEGEAPTDGGLDPTENTERLWPSIKLAFDVLFSSEYWSVAVPVAIGALVLAFVMRAFRTAAFFGLLVLLITLGGGWITWAIPELEITQDLGGNPIVRFMGSAALVCLAAAPLLLATVWARSAEAERS